MADTRKDCCRKEENLYDYRGPEIPSREEKPELTVMKCKECGCRHFSVNAEPIVLRMRTT